MIESNRVYFSKTQRTKEKWKFCVMKQKLIVGMYVYHKKFIISKRQQKLLHRRSPHVVMYSHLSIFQSHYCDTQLQKKNADLRALFICENPFQSRTA